MGLKYYAREANNGKEFLSVSPSADIPLYANLSSTLHHRHPCSVSASSIDTSSNTGTYANVHTCASVPNRNAMASATRPTAAFQTNNYFNISMLSSKMADLAADTSYAKLVNSISNSHLLKSPSVAKARTIDEKNNSSHEAYGDIRSYSITTKIDETVPQQQSSSPSAHTYINFERQDDTSPGISSPSPISEQKDTKGHYFSICPAEKPPIDIETNSTVSSTQVSLITLTQGSIAAKKLEVNMAPNCGDKSVLYRTKIPHLVPQIHPTFRQRRTTLHRSKRRRRRSTTPFRSMNSSHAQRRQKHHSNMTANVPQTKTSHRQRRRAAKSVSNRLYNIVPQPLLSDNHSLNSVYSDAEAQVCDYPVQFHGALQHHIIAWYPTVTCNEDELISQVVSVSENGESHHHSEIIAKEEEEEEEFLPHDTFEDFLLRRPRKSSSSPSASSTSSVSSEVRPTRPPPLARRSSGVALGLDKNDVDFIHNIIQRTQGDQRVSNRITALREAYTRAAIKENDLLKTKAIAKTDPEKAKKPIPIKRSVVTSKIRDELERYDELPVHRKTVFDDESDEDDDDTYSANIDYRYHRRALPPTPSTAHRILHFITAVKRQFQKSFHDFRSRVLIETMAMSSNHVSRPRHTLHEPRRYVPRPKTSHEIVRRSASHHPTDQLHRQQLYRTHSNSSQFHHARHPPAVEPQLTRRTQIPRSAPRQQRPARRT